jgi:hypothetical protein
MGSLLKKRIRKKIVRPENPAKEIPIFFMALRRILKIQIGKFQRCYSLDLYSPHQSRGFGDGNSVIDPSGML